MTEADASDAVDVVVEDDDVIEIDTEAEDASAQKGTIAIEDSSELTDTDETADTPETPTRVSVHDPSIVKQTACTMCSAPTPLPRVLRI
ncbi:MAG: hypothetical protein ACLTSZ_10390 [Lachnospiraceae bacterium]